MKEQGIVVSGSFFCCHASADYAAVQQPGEESLFHPAVF